MDNSRLAFFIVFCLSIQFLATGGIYSQNYEPVSLMVSSRAPLWYNESFKKQSNISKYIDSLKIVVGRDGPTLDIIDNKKAYTSDIQVEGAIYTIQSEFLMPMNCKCPFPVDWIININDDNRKRWIVAYYLDLFTSQTRDTLLIYEKERIESATKIINYGLERSDEQPWWEQADICENMLLHLASVSLGSPLPISFWIVNSKKIDNVYMLTVQGDERFYRIEKENRPLFIYNLPFPKYSERKTFQLILIPDGDYMDVYLDTMNTKLATFARVDKNFIPELKKLMAENVLTPSNISYWPRRTDGSMDYPPPRGVPGVTEDEINGKALSLPFVTTSNLRLRESASTTSKVRIIIKQGSRLQVLSKGSEETIDGIIAPWVQVKTQSGETGWCFGGYLEPKP